MVGNKNPLPAPYISFEFLIGGQQKPVTGPLHLIDGQWWATKTRYPPFHISRKSFAERNICVKYSFCAQKLLREIHLIGGQWWATKTRYRPPTFNLNF